MKLLGNARIRQVRVILGECPEVKYFKNMTDHCSPPWSSAVEDTAVYAPGWHLGGHKDVIRKSSAWRFTEPEYSNSSESYGPTLILYPAGGFIEDLGFEKDDTEDVLSTLIPQNWFDHMTRALFVELTLYNVNTGFFTQVILIAEQMPTGEYLKIAKAESVATDFGFDFWNVSFGLFLVFFFGRMCILMNRQGIFVYLSQKLKLFEVFLLCLGFLTVIFYFIHVVSSFDYIQQFHKGGIDEYFNFLNIVFYMHLSRATMAILFACVVIRMLFTWRFGRIYYTFFYTLLLSWPWIVWLLLYYAIYLVVVWRYVGYLFNAFLFPRYTVIIIYYKDFSVNVSDNFPLKVLVFAMCILSYVIILLFIASFAYYYKIGKCYKLIDTDVFSFYTFIKELTLKKRNKRKKN